MSVLLSIVINLSFISIAATARAGMVHTSNCTYTGNNWNLCVWREFQIQSLCVKHARERVKFTHARYFASNRYVLSDGLKASVHKQRVVFCSESAIPTIKCLVRAVERTEVDKCSTTIATKMPNPNLLSPNSSMRSLDVSSASDNESWASEDSYPEELPSPPAQWKSEIPWTPDRRRSSIKKPQFQLDPVAVQLNEFYENRVRISLERKEICEGNRLQHGA